MNESLRQVFKWLIKNWKYTVYGIQILQYLLKLRKSKPMKPEFKKFRELLVDFIIEKTDGGIFHKFIYEQVFNFLVGLLEEKASPEVIEVVEKFVLSITSQNDEELIAYLTDVINKKVDIPKLDEIEEGEIIESVLITLALAIRGFLTDKTN